MLGMKGIRAAVVVTLALTASSVSGESSTEFEQTLAAQRAQLPSVFLRQPPKDLFARAARKRWTPEKVAEFVARMPKVETHVHLDGALTQERLAWLAERQHYAPLAGKSAADIRAATMVTTPRASLHDVLQAFFSFYDLLKTPEAMEGAAKDLMAAAREQNIRYMEVRFAPALQATPEFPMEAVLQSVLKGLKTGGEASGVRSGVIICLYRPLPREVNEQMLDLAAKYRGRGVVGIDLAGDEAKNPLSEFADLFAKAKELGLYRTVHAGEVPGSSDLELALQLGVDRIGHGDLLAESPQLLKEVAQRHIPIEINITSNMRTGITKEYRDHPARKFFEAGAVITPSTDDPGVFGNTLTGEYMILANELGFSVPELIAIDLQSVDALFLPQAEKTALRRRFEREIATLLDR